MLFSVVAISCFLAVQAVPLGGYMSSGIGMGVSGESMDELGSEIGGRRGIGGGIGGGIEGGIGGGIGGIERSGSRYGRRGSEGGSRGYGSRGYEREGGSSAHDRGHLDQDFKKVVESHVSEGHDSGISEGYGTRGHERGGHSRYGADEGSYGNRYHSGLGI